MKTSGFWESLLYVLCCLLWELQPNKDNIFYNLIKLGYNHFFLSQHTDLHILVLPTEQSNLHLEITLPGVFVWNTPYISKTEKCMDLIFCAYMYDAWHKDLYKYNGYQPHDLSLYM